MVYRKRKRSAGPSSGIKRRRFSFRRGGRAISTAIRRRRRRFRNRRFNRRVVEAHESNDHELTETTALSGYGGANTFNSVYDINTGPSWCICNYIQQGTSQSQRIGRRIFMKGIMIKGWLAGADTPYNTFRISCFRFPKDITLDMGSSGNYDLDTKLYDPTGTSIWQYNKRIFYDKKFVLNANGGTVRARPFNLWIPVNQYCYYDTASLDGYRDKIILAMISDSAAVSNPGFIHTRIRIIWKDT